MNGGQISWDGCGTTYRVVVTLTNGTQPVLDTVVNSTMANAPNLEPNQEYTISVFTRGSSCDSEPATMSFIAQSYVRTTQPHTRK